MDVTQILRQIEAGDQDAADRLLPLVYEELRGLAAARMSLERVDHSLNATALVHEAYLRMAGTFKPGTYQNRSHFFAVAATAMRRILVDRARARRTAKRNNDRLRVELSDVAEPEVDKELLALDEALKRLAELDPIKAQLVDLRYFAGLTVEQAAVELNISSTTANRYWRFARAWLQAEVHGG